MTVFVSHLKNRSRFLDEGIQAIGLLKVAKPVQFQLWVRIFGRNRKPTRPLVWGGGCLHDFGIMEVCH